MMVLPCASNAHHPKSAPQSVYRLYPKAFQVKYYGIQVLEHNFGRSSLFSVVAKLWFVYTPCVKIYCFFVLFLHAVAVRRSSDLHAAPRQSLKEHSASAVRPHLQANFLKMLDTKDEPHAGIVGSP